MRLVEEGGTMGGSLMKSKMFKAGLGLLVVGASPLLLYVLYEFVSGAKGGNPIGLGLLFFVTFWPGVIMMLIGVVGVLRSDK